MYNIMLTLFIINILFLMYAIYFSFRLGFKAASKIEASDISNIDNVLIKYKSKWVRLCFKVLYIFIVIIFLVFIVILSLYIAWVPILVWNIWGLYYGILSLFIVALSDSYISSKMLHKAMLDVKKKELIILSEVIRYSSIFLALLLFSDLKANSLNELMVNIYNTNLSVKTTVMVFIPTTLIAFIATNLLALYKRAKFLFNKNLEKYKTTSRRSVLLSIVLFSFFGLFYLNQLDLSFVSENDLEIIKGAMNLYGVVLTAFFIPLFIDDLSKRNIMKPIMIPQRIQNRLNQKHKKYRSCRKSIQ